MATFQYVFYVQIQTSSINLHDRYAHIYNIYYVYIKFEKLVVLH